MPISRVLLISFFAFFLSSCMQAPIQSLQVSTSPRASSTEVARTTQPAEPSPTRTPTPALAVTPMPVLTSTPQLKVTLSISCISEDETDASVLSRHPPLPFCVTPVTPRPTDTPYFTPTFPAATLAALATLDAVVTQHPEVGEYYSWSCVVYVCYTSGLGLSPNGEWAVFWGVKGSGGGLKIIRLDGEKLWEVYVYDLLGIDEDFTGAGSVWPAHWSRDGHYFYVIPRLEGDGGDFGFWRKGEKLIQLDLLTGQWIDTKMGSAFSFSPDDKYLAYRGQDGVHIHNLQTGVERKFTLPSDIKKFGHFTWSPDSDRIAFIAYPSENDLYDLGGNQFGFTGFLLNVKTGLLTTIFENDMRFIYPVEWTEPGYILFKELKGWQLYMLDLRTNEFKPADPP